MSCDVTDWMKWQTPWLFTLSSLLRTRRLSSSDRVLSTSAPSIPFGDRLVRTKKKEKEAVAETSQITVEEKRKMKKITMHLDEEMLGRYHDEALSLTLSRETESKKQVKCIKNWVRVHQSEWSWICTGYSHTSLDVTELLCFCMHMHIVFILNWSFVCK